MFLKKACIILVCATLMTASSNATESRTQVVLLGTGNPNADPERSGCSIAIIVDDQSYLIDMGPGLVRQATALSPRWGGEIEALAVENLKRVFVTHLHSDQDRKSVV